VILNPTLVVSIACITYNQENFIKDAIEGFLMQKTTFPIEIIINDDASTDNTAKIVTDYSDKYPNLIIPIFHKENQYSQGINPGIEFVFPKCKGKYIAICEGDDYWTDPYKLQKQVDFLEANEDFMICFHNMKIIYDDGREEHLSNSPDQKEVTTIEDLAHGNYIYTASCVFRNGLIKKFPEWYNSSPVGDYVLHMLNAKHGKIKFIPDVMGVYRVHKGGTWGNMDYIIRIEKWVELLELMKNHFNKEVIDIFMKTQSNYYSILIEHYKNNAEKCKYYSKLKMDCDPYLIIELNKQIEELRNKYETVLNSRTYNVGAIILKPYSFLKRIMNV
jgi:glycosyltransferase involved in cell wall biosynthesis